MSERAHLDLVRLGTTAGADEIKDTAVTQPLVVATALLAAGTLDVPAGAVTAGHSVGELAAAAIAGVLSRARRRRPGGRPRLRHGRRLRPHPDRDVRGARRRRRRRSFRRWPSSTWWAPT